MLNKEWHLSHKMPEKATLDQKIEWHLEHQKYCNCHPGLPKSIQIELEKRKQK